MSDHTSQDLPVPTDAATDENRLIAERRAKLNTLRTRQAQGLGPAFPNDFTPTDHAAELLSLIHI